MDGGRSHFLRHRRRGVVAISRWWLLEASPSPVDVRQQSHRLNFSLGIVLVVFMAVSVLALVCCCYHLEWRLRLQARNAARRVSRASGVLGQNAEKATKQETNLSVMMPGDSIPSFLAKAKPHGPADLAEYVPAIGAKDALHR